MLVFELRTLFVLRSKQTMFAFLAQVVDDSKHKPFLENFKIVIKKSINLTIP